MAEIKTKPLMSLKLQVSGMQAIGAAPGGDRRVGLVAGGTFSGEALNGTVLPGGADWIITRPDGCMTLDVRLVLQTDDGALIGLTYRGLRHGPADVMAKVAAALRALAVGDRSQFNPARPAPTPKGDRADRRPGRGSR